MSTPNPWTQSLPSRKPPPIGAILLVLFALTGLFTAYYTVPAESEGVVLRFGRHQQNVPPGLHLKLPFGIDEVIKVPTQRQLKLSTIIPPNAGDNAGASRPTSMIIAESLARSWLRKSA